jgi:bleomycin hydrolase
MEVVMTARNIQKLLPLLVLLLSVPILAQYVPGPGEDPSPAGALTKELADSIQGGFALTPAQRATQNALADNEINTLVVDRQKTLADDTLFTHVIKGGKITAQDQSGRCWLFAGLNMVRTPVLKKYNLENFELSQAYSQFYDKMERANRSLELAIALRDEPLDSRKNALLLSKPIEDGGDWNFVVYLVDKYGVVPKGVMPDTWSAGHTDQMNRLLSTRMRKGILALRKAAAAGAGVDALRAQKADTLKDIYRILVLCLGEPPASFTWRYEDKDHKVSELKSYTPQSFLKEFVGVKLSDYVNVVNYPGKPIHQTLSFSWNRDAADGADMRALNVTTDEMKAMAKASVLADEAVWFCCNSSPQRNSKTGLWDQGIQDYGTLFGVDFTVDKADGLASGDQAPNHCMVLIGVNVDKAGRPDKWKVENSWGDKRGRDGFWTITDSWFDANVYEVLLNRKHVPPELLKLADSNPAVLPPWDPFSN